MSPPAGRGRVQHREGPPGPDSEAENNGILREKREADRAAEENVSCFYTFWGGYFLANAIVSPTLVFSNAFKVPTVHFMR